MKFDLTREIQLDPQSQRIYQRWQLVLYSLAAAGAIVVFIMVVFPTQYFAFSFLNPKSTKNNILRPRTAANALPDRGKVEAAAPWQFDAALIGAYSKAVVYFDLSKKSDPIGSGEVSVRKGYQAFFYPEGQPMRLPEVTDPNGITDGSLVSYGDSVYLISKSKSYPIDSVDTFMAQGYSWDDVKPISPDELATYAKQKLFTLWSPHPDGTIFKTDSGQYYIIEEGQKHKLVFDNISQLPPRQPILVSEKSLEIFQSCSVEKQMLTWRTYKCEIPVASLQSLLGMDYEFSASTNAAIKMDNLRVEFKKDVSLANFKSKVREIIARVKNNYIRPQ